MSNKVSLISFFKNVLFHELWNFQVQKLLKFWASQVLLVVKNLPTSVGDAKDTGRSLGREDPLEEGMATHCSILAWRIPWAEEPGGLQSTRSQTAGHDWSDLAHTHVITPQRGAGGLSLHLRRNPVDSSHFEHYQPPQKWVAVNQLLSPGLSVGFVLLEKTKCLCSEESHDTVKLF